MSRSYSVTLKGTWQRRNTTASDVREFRRGLAQFESELGDGTHFIIRESRKDSDDGLRVGWFTVRTMPVVKLARGAGMLTEARAKERARAMVKWVVQDLACVAPKLTYESQEAYEL